MFTIVDYTTIILYVIALLAIGFFSSRKQSDESFLISERKIGVFSGLATINATKTGSIIFIFTALLYDYGFSAIWYFIGIVLGYLVFLPFSRRLFENSNFRYYTLADHFRENYGKVSGFMASGLTILTMVGFLIINLIAATKVLQFFSGFDFIFSAMIVAAIVLIYLVMAGFNAVVKTDVFQYVAIIFVLATFAIILGNGIDIPASEWTLFSASTTDVIGFLLIGILFPFAAPDLWQRIYSLKDSKTLTKSLLWSVVVFGVVAFILSLVGLFIKSALPDLDPDFALVGGLSQLLPVGLSGLALVVFFAALMSSIDTYVYTASSALVQDFKKNLSKSDVVKHIRYTMAIIMVASTVLAVLIQDLIEASFIFASFVIVLAIPSIATWLRPQIKKTTLDTAFIVGTIILVAFVSVDFVAGSLTPAIVIKGIEGSVIGLVAGAIISKFKTTRAS